MIRNYFKIAYRNIIKNKGFFALNAGGLILGLTAVILIGLWINDELEYNGDFADKERIAQIMQNQTFAGEIQTRSNVPLQLAPVLQNEYGDYFENVVLSTYTAETGFSFENKKLLLNGNFAEPDLPLLLDLEMLEGSREVMADPSFVLLSETAAKAIFGNKEAMNKTVQIGTTMSAVVGGVYKDLPKNSDFSKLEFIASWQMLEDTNNFESRLGWGNNWFQTWVKINPGVSMTTVNEQIKNIKKDRYEDSDEAELFLFPLEKWHLYSQFENGKSVGGNIEYVNIFGIVGFAILLLACINFLNLSTARALKRSKEVGIRKTLGSNRTQLIGQFISESVIVVALSYLIAVIIAKILMPSLNDLTLKEISLPLGSATFWLIGFGLVGVTALLASTYPALYLSGFDVIKSLKGKFSDKGNAGLRKGLVVFQFSISIILIIGTLTVLNQINHVKHRPINYDQNLLVSIPINSKNVRDNFDGLKSELLSSPSISNVAASDVKIADTYVTNGGFEWRGKDPNMSDSFRTLRFTHGLGEMIDWQIVKGRDFSEDFKSDSLSFIINETAVKYMGFEDPIGENVRWGNNGVFKIVGVVKDMVTQSPFDQIEPSIYVLHYGSFLSLVNIEVSNSAATSTALDHAKEVFGKYDPDSLFSYSFMDEDYAKRFDSEERFAKLVAFFTSLAILISCLGVLGLSIFMIEQRKKEIGMRKVLGASVGSIWKLLSKQVLVLVAISCLIAMPLGYYFGTNWLNNFQYRSSLDFWVLAVAGISVVLITLVTLSYHTIKAAFLNPIKILRTE